MRYTIPTAAPGKLKKTADVSFEPHLPFRVLHPEEARRYYQRSLYEAEEPFKHFVQFYRVMRRDPSADEAIELRQLLAVG